MFFIVSLINVPFAYTSAETFTHVQTSLFNYFNNVEMEIVEIITIPFLNLYSIRVIFIRQAKQYL